MSVMDRFVVGGSRGTRFVLVGGGGGGGGGDGGGFHQNCGELLGKQPQRAAKNAAVRIGFL